MDLRLFKIGGYVDLGLFKTKGANYPFLKTRNISIADSFVFETVVIKVILNVLENGRLLVEKWCD